MTTSQTLTGLLLLGFAVIAWIRFAERPSAANLLAALQRTIPLV